LAKRFTLTPMHFFPGHVIPFHDSRIHPHSAAQSSEIATNLYADRTVHKIAADKQTVRIDDKDVPFPHKQFHAVAEEAGATDCGLIGWSKCYFEKNLPGSFTNGERRSLKVDVPCLRSILKAILADSKYGKITVIEDNRMQEQVMACPHFMYQPL